MGSGLLDVGRDACGDGTEDANAPASDDDEVWLYSDEGDVVKDA